MVGCMSDTNGGSVVRWWAVLAAGTAASILIAWLAHVAGVRLMTVLSIAAGGAALAWLILLLAGPWNLYFAARRVMVQMAVSRELGIGVPEAEEAEAARIQRRMLWFALGGHVVTALVTGVITYVSGAGVGYYVAGFYLLSATIRPAAAYFSHLRERIGALSRESLHPREDVLSLREQVDLLTERVKHLTSHVSRVDHGGADNLRQAEAKLADDLAHARQVLTADLSRVQDAQAADRQAARSRDDDLGRRIDRMARRIEDTLDGISDHQELQAGLRALVRMIRTDASA
jgi:ribosomal protein S15P/S13E